MNDTINFDEAVQMLPEGEYVHTFRNAGFMMLGADWPRDRLMAAMQESQIFVSGDVAQSMNHGIAIKNDGGFLFIETKPDAKLKEQGT